MKTKDKKYLAWALFILPALFWLISLGTLVFISFTGEIDNFNLREIPFLTIFLILATISTVVAIIIYIIVVSKWNKKEKRLQEAILYTDISQVDTLTPYEFEEWIARFLRTSGYKAEATKKSGDYGVDVIAEKENVRIAIQVKKFTKSVGVKAVQEVISGMDYYNCYEGWVMTTAPYFTQAAINLAKTRNIKLYNKNDLALLLYELQKINNVSVPILGCKKNEKTRCDKESFNQTEPSNKNMEIVKPEILRFGDKKYQYIRELCGLFTYKAIGYMLDKFKNDNIFMYDIDNMPYIYEFISPGKFICEQLFNLLEKENEKAPIYDIEYVKLSGMFYVGMGVIYLWKKREVFNINETLEILIQKNGLLYLDESVLNKFKISIKSEGWKEFYEKFDKYQIELLNDFDIDYIYHENDLSKYFNCMHAMYILGMLFAIQKLT